MQRIGKFNMTKLLLLIPWIYGRISSLRSLGIKCNYPFGCRTFREFLQELKK